jgi:uncharacterized protein (DUF433 family)
MPVVQLSAKTYHQLRQQAEEEAKTPDQVAESLLQAQLNSQHPYIEIVERYSGLQPVIKGTRITVSDIVGYLRLGETPESLVRNILPQLTLAQVYDALSYYHDHQDEIEQILHENTETQARAYLREKLGEEGYLRLTGQRS